MIMRFGFGQFVPVQDKNKTNCKPISRILYFLKKASVIYLGQQSPTTSICLPSGKGEQPFDLSHTGIHGISTHKVYPLLMLPPTAVRSYRTFSPLPQTNLGRLFSATLAVFYKNPTRQVVCCSALFGLSSRHKGPATERLAVGWQIQLLMVINWLILVIKFFINLVIAALNTGQNNSKESHPSNKQ